MMNGKLALLWHYFLTRRNFTRWRDREVLEQWQDRQVQRHLRRFVPRSRYYRELFADRPLNEWRDFPVSNKAALMGRFDDWNIAGVTLKEASAVADDAERSRNFDTLLHGCTVGMSSGTSGSRGLFLATAAERAAWAGTLLARVLHGTLGSMHRAALFLRADSTLYQSLGSRRFRFAFFDLFEPLEPQWARLQAHRPTILAAPPAALVRMAAFPGAATLLEPPGLLYSVADVLDDADRVIIERGFGCRLNQIYQATEGFLAVSCPYGHLHWNEDIMVVQKRWLDREHTRFTPVITDFMRQTQPMLRYALDDVIVEPESNEPCPCGSIFGRLGKIEGRKDDVLYLPAASGNGWIPLFPDFIRRGVILGVPIAVEYRVVQVSADHWSVALSEPQHAAAVQRELERICREAGGAAPRFTFDSWTEQPLHAKQRRIRREMPAPPLAA